MNIYIIYSRIRLLSPIYIFMISEIPRVSVFGYYPLVATPYTFA